MVYRQWWPANCLGHEQACIVFVSALARSFSFCCSQLGELGQQGFIQGSSAAEEEDLRLIQGMLILNTAGCTFNQHPRVTLSSSEALQSFLLGFAAVRSSSVQDGQKSLSGLVLRSLINEPHRSEISCFTHISRVFLRALLGDEVTLWLWKDARMQRWRLQLPDSPPTPFSLTNAAAIYDLPLTAPYICVCVGGGSICASMQQTQHLFLINSFIYLFPAD